MKNSDARLICAFVYDFVKGLDNDKAFELGERIVKEFHNSGYDDFNKSELEGFYDYMKVVKFEDFATWATDRKNRKGY